MFFFKKKSEENKIEEMRQKNQDLEKKLDEMQKKCEQLSVAQNKSVSAEEVKKIAAKNIDLEEKVRRMENLVKNMEIGQNKKGSGGSNPFLPQHQPLTSAVNSPTWNQGNGGHQWSQPPPNTVSLPPNVMPPMMGASGGMPPPWTPAVGPMHPPQPFYPVLNNELPANQPSPQFRLQIHPNQLNSCPSNQQAPISNLQNRNQGSAPQQTNAANFNRLNEPRNSPEYQSEWKNRNENRAGNYNNINRNFPSRLHNDANRQVQCTSNVRNHEGRQFPNDSKDPNKNRSQNRPLFRGRGNRGRNQNSLTPRQQDETNSKDEGENNKYPQRFDNRGRGGNRRGRGRSYNVIGQERGNTEEKEFHQKKHRFVRGGVNKRYEDKGKLHTSDLDSDDTESFEELTLDNLSDGSDSGNFMEAGNGKSSESKQGTVSKSGNKPHQSRNDVHHKKHSLVRGRIQKRHHDKRAGRSSDVDSNDMEAEECQTSESLLDVTSSDSKGEDKKINSNEGACGATTKKHRNPRNKNTKNLPQNDAGCSGESKKNSCIKSELILSKNNMGENNLLANFIGTNIPSLMDALLLTTDLERKVANVVLMSDPDEMSPILETPKTLGDIVKFKTKYPKAKSILL